MTNKDETRWEFRCWPCDVSPLWAQIEREYVRHDEERRTDTYFLSSARKDLMPKLRGGDRFEIKQLMETRDALEKWSLPISVPSPLVKADAERIAVFFKDISAERLTGCGGEQLEVLFGSICHTHRVEKHRALFTLGDLQAELTAARAHGSIAFSVGFECEDAETLHTEHHRLGLSAFENIAYFEALEARRIFAA